MGLKSLSVNRCLENKTRQIGGSWAKRKSPCHIPPPKTPTALWSLASPKTRLLSVGVNRHKRITANRATVTPPAVSPPRISQANRLLPLWGVRRTARTVRPPSPPTSPPPATSPPHPRSLRLRRLLLPPPKIPCLTNPRILPCLPHPPSPSSPPRPTSRL